MTACGASSTGAGGPSGAAAAPEQQAPSAPTDVGSSIDGRTPAEICARIPAAALDRLATIKPGPVRAAKAATYTACQYPAPKGGSVAHVMIGPVTSTSMKEQRGPHGEARTEPRTCRSSVRAPTSSR